MKTYIKRPLITEVYEHMPLNRLGVIPEWAENCVQYCTYDDYKALVSCDNGKCFVDLPCLIMKVEGGGAPIDREELESQWVEVKS